MALAKEGYRTAINGTAVAKAPVDTSGNLILNGSGTTPSGTKNFQFTRTNAGNSRSQNLEVINTFFGFSNTAVEGNADTFKVTWEVE